MKVEYAEETSVRKSLAFEIEPEVVDREIEQRAREYARNVKLPGFRKGKIPGDVVRKRFRSQILEEVAEKLVNKLVFEEIEGRGLKPVSNPKVVELKIDESQPLTFRAIFETLPIVEVPEWRGLSVKQRQPQVGDLEVDQELDRLREANARFDPIEGRPAADGDYALADVSWKPAAGGKPRRNENAMIEVGAAGNFKEINAALAGMSAGETKQVRVEEAPAEGQPGPGQSWDYTLALKSLKAKLLPAADDDFAKDLGEFASLAELREKLRSQILANEQRRIDHETKSALVDALLAKSQVEVPESLVERYMDSRLENAVRGLAVQGIDPSKAGVDWRQYRDGQRESATRAVRADILLDEIARRESVSVSEAELDAEVARLAERARRSKDAMRAQLEKEGDLDALRGRLREDKVLELLKASATLDRE
ncbi:MAG: trigger factor [Vicinamibacteria bacterium]